MQENGLKGDAIIIIQRNKKKLRIQNHHYAEQDCIMTYLFVTVLSTHSKNKLYSLQSVYSHKNHLFMVEC